MVEAASQAVLGVSELVEALRERLFALGEFWVEGEIGSVFRSGAGHWYFDLKDQDAQLRAVFFAGDAREAPLEPEHGMLVRAHGRLDLYAQRGALQLVVDRIVPAGEGALRIAFERLKARLQAEGLFDPDHKKPLPFLPRRIGLVTSVQGAAIHDFLRGLRRRFPAADVLVFAARMQGEGAWREIVRGLHLLDAQPEVDTIVLTRGGGSAEDLWTFNREELVRAIFELETPLVSAIGHEVDLVLTDLVADARASTPTAAAELVVPDAAKLGQAVTGLARRLSRAQRARLDSLGRRLEALRRGVVHPARRLAELAHRLEGAHARLRAAVRRLQERGATRLAAASGRLDALSPLAVLSRGYSITRRSSDGAIVRRSADVAAGDEIDVRLAQDALRARVLLGTR